MKAKMMAMILYEGVRKECRGLTIEVPLTSDTETPHYP